MADLPEETFRIRPWRESPFWVLVRVAPTLTAMRKELREFSGDCHPEQLAATLQVVPPNEKIEPHLAGLVAVMFFARTWLGGSLVTHELAHVAFRVCDTLRIRVKHWQLKSYTLQTQPTMWEASDEEKYCNFIEHLSRDFWREARARRLAS